MMEPHKAKAIEKCFDYRVTGLRQTGEFFEKRGLLSVENSFNEGTDAITPKSRAFILA